MDGSLVITIIGSSAGIGSIIAGGFWVVVAKIGQQDKSIGRIEGKVDGLITTAEVFQGQLNGFDERLGRIDQRINGVVSSGDKEATQ